MMHIRKWTCGVLAAAMLLTVATMSGCSTPKNAVTIDKQNYSTGEYIAYLFNAYSTVYSQNQLYYYKQYGQDIWGMSLPFKENGKSTNKKLADWLKSTAVANMKYQRALEIKMKEFGISLSADQKKSLNDSLKQLNEDDILKFGMSKESYTKMYTAVYGNEHALFYGLYGKGGKREMSDKDIQAYYDKNYLSYKIIEVSLTGTDGKEYDDTKKASLKKDLQKYLDQYTKSKDFDAVIKQYKKDNKQEDTTNDKDAKDPNRVDLDSTLASDELLVKAVKNVKVGDASIQEYKKSGSTPTLALILRLDPNVRVKGDNYYTDNRDAFIYGAHYKEFQAEIQAVADKLDTKVNDRAVKMCDPKSFDTDQVTTQQQQ